MRKYVNGEYHVEGDLVLATRERQALMLDNLEPLLRVLRHRKVILVTPMLRYLYESCCGREDHAPNRMEDGFEEELRRSLGEFRLNIKNFSSSGTTGSKLWTRLRLCLLWTATEKRYGGAIRSTHWSTATDCWWTCTLKRSASSRRKGGRDQGAASSLQRRR